MLSSPTLGSYHRQIRLVAHGTTVIGDLEDDFHRVHVELEHDGVRVIHCRGETPRIPWTTGPAAADELARFAGLPLGHSLLAAGRHSDPRGHCTHLFDVAALAVAHAAAGRSARHYAIEIPDRIDGCTHPALARDGAPLLAWQLEGDRIVAPVSLAGRRIWGDSLAARAEAELAPEDAEAVLVLQRACAISLGRGFDLDAMEHAQALAPRTLGNCYTFAPGKIERARRNRGTTRDFSARPADLLSD